MASVVDSGIRGVKGDSGFLVEMRRSFSRFSTVIFVVCLTIDIKSRRWPGDWKDQEVAARFITSAK